MADTSMTKNSGLADLRLKVTMPPNVPSVLGMGLSFVRTSIDHS